MVGICFYFEDSDTDVWSGKNLDAWNYAAKCAGDIDTFLVINQTDQTLTTPDANLTFRVEPTLPELSGRVTYLVCPWDNTPTKMPLWNFDHATDWYVFGPAKGWSSIESGVYIPQSGRGACHSVHIATVVMMHRYGVRSWQ